jgi:hypothetical protein
MSRDVDGSSTPVESFCLSSARGRVLRRLLAGCALLASLTASPLGAQQDFRRGDANVDGVVDVSDASFINRYLFLGLGSPSCDAAADTDDSGSINLTDTIRILNVLFLGIGELPPPGPNSPGPDPTPDDLDCGAYDPSVPPKNADLDLALECLGPDPSGTPGRHQVAVTLTTRNNTAGEGAEAWSLSIGAEGYQVVSATTAGTAAALTTDTPPGYRDPDSSFSRQEVIDPDRIVGLGPQGPGAVAAIQLSTGGGANQLPGSGTVRLLILTVEEDPPGGPGPHRLFFADGKQGSGRPVRNVITIGGTSQVAIPGTLEECIPDCNANGRADAADIFTGASKDCDESTVPDECEIASGTSEDCNANGIPDACDIAAGTSEDCNANGIPDSCDGSEDPNDCNGNGKPDRCDIELGVSEDCNANGIPDSCDIAAGRSEDCGGNAVPDECEPDCNSNGRADTCDISLGESADHDGDGVPDECRCECLCPTRDPIPCEPGAGPQFRLGFRGDCVAVGSPSAPRLKAFVTLGQFCLPPGNSGAQGWLFGVEVLEGTPISVTTSGTAAAPTTEGGFRNPTLSFEKTQVIDPARNGGRKGVVTAVALSIGGPGTFELPRQAEPHDILQLEVELSSTGSCPRATLRHERDLVGAGNPVNIVVTYQGASQIVVTGEATWERCGDGGGLQSPGDANQDGSTNIADAIWLLGHLFLGTFPVLPCDGGTASTPAPGALSLLDQSGDGDMDLTDPIGLLNHLFSSGPPHPLGAGCTSVAGCPDTCAAP